jgi:hypothetical protein
MTLSTRAREQLYNAEVKKARDAKRGEFPICRLCDLPITPGQKWDANHQAHMPRWLGGVIDGLSHRRCNRAHNARHDTPKFHKNNRLRQKHIGAHRSAQPMRFGRDSAIKLRMNGTPVYRDSGKPVLVRPWIKSL